MNQAGINQTNLSATALASVYAATSLQGSRRFTQILCVCLCLALGACSNSGRINYDDQQHKQRQASAMERWNRCFENHLASSYDSQSTANAAINSSLEICQGHRYDVVAMYPRRLEKGLDKKLVELAYKQGLRKLSAENHTTVLQRFIAIP